MTDRESPTTVLSADSFHAEIELEKVELIQINGDDEQVEVQMEVDDEQPADKPEAFCTNSDVEIVEDVDESPSTLISVDLGHSDTEMPQVECDANTDKESVDEFEGFRSNNLDVDEKGLLSTSELTGEAFNADTELLPSVESQANVDEEESVDEFEAFRMKLDVEDNADDLGLLSENKFEIIIHGTKERNEQEEFQLQMAKDYFSRGLDYWTESEMDMAMLEFSRSLEIREDICGRQDSETAKCYLWVGTIHFLKDEFDLALDDFSRCFRIQYEMANNNQDACNVVKNWINKSLDAKGVEKEEEKTLYWKKFMTCIEQDQKGDSLKESGKYDRAIDLYGTAVKFEYLRRQLNPALPGRPLADCADLYYKMGRCYHSMGTMDRAMVEYRQALAIYHARYGENHRHTMKTSEKMFDMIIEMGYQPHLAEEYVDSIPQSVRHEQTGDWLVDINKTPEAAIKEYEAALEKENGYVGRTQVACATLFYKLGNAHHRWNKPQQAFMYWVRAAGIFESVLGAQHKDTTTVMKMIRTETANPQQTHQS